MTDYTEISKLLRNCSAINGGCTTCPMIGKTCCVMTLQGDAADAIDELLAAEPPSLWTDEPIEGTEFMTHSQGGRKGFEIHFRTDSAEKYMAVQEECRRQIDHAKPTPPKGVE